MAANADNDDIGSIRRHLGDLQHRVDDLAAYQETDAQTTLRIEHQIELLQLQIDKLTDLIGRIGRVIDIDE